MSKAPAVKSARRGRNSTSYKAYLYLAPAILVMLVFVLYPLVKVFRMGFYTKYNYLTEVGKGFGLKAFEHVLGDPFLPAGAQEYADHLWGRPADFADHRW